MGSAPASLADNPFLITLLLEMQTTIFLRTEMSRKTEYVHNPCFLSANILKILGVFAENQINKDSVKILNQYLVEFMAAKRMDLICCCQSEIEFDLGAIDLPFEIECTNGKFKDISPNAKSNYQICISPHFAKIQSWFNGKIIFNHESLKSIIERMKTSVNYIIGTDVNGAPIASTVATDPYTPVF